MKNFIEIKYLFVRRDYDMRKTISKIVMLLFLAGIALSCFTGNVQADSAGTGNMSTAANENRLWGKDRIETSLKISQEGWKYGAATAVIAQGYGYADALCAAPLAKKYNAPIILSKQDSLSDEIVKELKRLKADRVFVIGGTGSLSDYVELQLKEIGVSQIKRLGGQDRYETSVKVAEELGDVSNIAVASGSGYADSLSISAIAAEKEMPILLSQNDELPQIVKNYLKNRNIEKTYIIGGTGVISSSLESSFTNVMRLGGATRFDTNLAVLQNFKSDLNFNNVYIARGNGPNGDEFADALSGAALAATKSAPVVLTDDTVASKTADFLKENMSDKTMLTALGGTSVVPAVILDDLIHYFNGESTSGGIGDETKPGTGGGGVVVPTTGNNFTLVISRDNGTIIKQKVFDIYSSKNALDYLKSMASVNESSGLITSIDSNSSVPISGLSDSDRKSGYYGIDWFIYLNGTRTGVGIQSVNIQPGSTLNLDYHKWDWHDLVDPGTTAVPLSLSIPDSIQAGKSITVKFTCAGKPVYGAAISVDGKSSAATDENGNADITVTTSGSHDIKAEKDSGQDKGSVTKTVNVSSSGGGGGSSSTIDVTGVTLNTSEVTMAQGNVLRLIPTVEPEGASNKNVTWSSSDEKVAAVDSNGIVTAVGQGNAAITVTTKNSGKTASCAVTVTNEKAKNYNDYESYINSLVNGITSNISSIDAWTAMELNKLGKAVPDEYLSDFEQQIKDTPDKVLKQPTDYTKAVLGVVAAGEDPTNFAGQNLVEKIYNYDEKSMADQGISAYVFSLIALDSANFSVPDGVNWTRQNLVDKILSYKTSDGGWTFYGDTADPDMTSMAISALTPYKYRSDVNSAVNAAVDKLSSMQSENGGFASWGVENPNSVEMVIIALCDSGIDPVKDTAFIKNGKNPVDALMSFKADDNSGFYGVDGNVIKSVDPSATEQGLRALVAYKLFNQGKGSVYRNFVDYDTDINNLINGVTSKISSSPDDWTVMELNKLGKPIPSDYLTDLQQKIKSTSEDEYFKYFTTYARTVIGIVAAGGDPTNFAGKNLVEKIYNGEQYMQGVNDYVYSLIALDSANFTVPDGIRQELVDKILSYKISDGGWTYSGDTADPDMTSMAISALAPYKDREDVKSAVDSAVDKLSSMQSEDGGYASYGIENPNSVEMVIIGLCDNGIDPASDDRFIKSGGNPISALFKFAVSDNTGFWSPWNTDKTVDSYATEQGLRAITAYKLFKDGKGSVYKNFTDVDTTDIPVDSITLDKTRSTLKEEETLKLTSTVSPENATDKKVNWKSDDSTVAIVDEYGNVIAVGPGQTDITATVEDGGKSSSCSITVEKGEAINVSLNITGYNGNILNEDIKAEDGEVKDGETVYRLFTTMFYKNNISYEIYNDPSWGHYVNMIDGQKSDDRGLYSGWSYNINGESAQGGIDSYKLKDGDKIDMFFTADFANPFRDIDSITLDKSDLDLNVGDVEKLTAAAAPDNTTEALIWTSDTPSVAAVDADGNVTAVSKGTATITVKPQYNTHAETVSCVVNVK
jgi:uncharacterized protein YjdB/putative cell wall-binding protein